MHLPPRESFQKQILFKHFEPELSSCVFHCLCVACLPVTGHKIVAQQKSVKESVCVCVCVRAARCTISASTLQCARAQ